MVTSHDVARAAGVSQATVSRVLSGSPKVAPQTRERVLSALTATGYTPNLVARAMRTRRTGTIGVVVASITNPFYPELIEAVAGALSRADSRMILWIADGGAGEESALEAIRQQLVDGIIFTTVTERTRALHEALTHAAPVVMLNRAVAGAHGDQVTSDNVAGGVAVADHFVQGGHRRIGLISGPQAASTAVKREAGFREGLAAHGTKLAKTRCRAGGFTHSGGFEAMRWLLGRPRPPTAVFCVNDLSAFGAVDAARTLGIKVPEDLWIAGYDDISMSGWAGYDLTTVRQPIADMSAKAVSLLMARIEDPLRPIESLELHGRLVVRRSTGGRGDGGDGSRSPRRQPGAQVGRGSA